MDENESYDKRIYDKRNEYRETLKRYRAEIITKAIEVEEHLSYVICLLLNNGIINERLIDIDYVVLTDLTFNAKREMLRKALLISGFKDKNVSTIDGMIQDVLAIRNKLAHAFISSDLFSVSQFDGHTIDIPPSFKFEKGSYEIRSGKKVIKKIDQARIEKELKNMDDLLGELSRIEEKMKVDK